MVLSTLLVHVDLQSDQPLKTPLKNVTDTEKGDPEKTPLLFKPDSRRKGLVQAVWVSVIFNLIIGVLALGFAIEYQCVSNYGFALDAILDVVASAILLYRFMGKNSEEGARKKEKKACFWLGILFIFSAIAVGAISFIQLYYPFLKHRSSYAFIFEAISAVVCFILAGVLWYYNTERDHSVTLEVVNSIIGGLMSCFILLSELMLFYGRSLELLDPSISIVLGFVLLGYGAHAVRESRL